MTEAAPAKRIEQLRSELRRHEHLYYVLDAFAEDIDYCDAKREMWVWSIGRRKSDGVILASMDTVFYQNDAFDCLWLR